VIHLSMYDVLIKKSARKKIEKAPEAVQFLFDELIDDLKTLGPIVPAWPNYSKLGGDRYHCHLNYSWVACWLCEAGTVKIEVYYAGSREDAPY
jgi:hypothetical protein